MRHSRKRCAALFVIVEAPDIFYRDRFRRQYEWRLLFGKECVLTFWTREVHSDCSEPFGRSRFSSGSGAELCGGLNSKVAIMLPDSFVNRLVSGLLLGPVPTIISNLLGDAYADQVAHGVSRVNGWKPPGKSRCVKWRSQPLLIRCCTLRNVTRGKIVLFAGTLV